MKYFKAGIIPAFLLFFTMIGLYEAYKSKKARDAQFAINNLPADSKESKEWVRWSTQQSGYADPEKFLEYWNNVVDKK